MDVIPKVWDAVTTNDVQNYWIKFTLLIKYALKLNDGTSSFDIE